MNIYFRDTVRDVIIMDDVAADDRVSQLNDSWKQTDYDTFHTTDLNKEVDDDDRDEKILSLQDAIEYIGFGTFQVNKNTTNSVD